MVTKFPILPDMWIGDSTGDTHSTTTCNSGLLLCIAQPSLLAAADRPLIGLEGVMLRREMVAHGYEPLPAVTTERSASGAPRAMEVK